MFLMFHPSRYIKGIPVLFADDTKSEMLLYFDKVLLNEETINRSENINSLEKEKLDEWKEQIDDLRQRVKDAEDTMIVKRKQRFRVNLGLLQKRRPPPHHTTRPPLKTWH